MSKSYKDPCSFSSSEHFSLSHVDLDWTIDFEQKIIEGTARLSFNSNSNSSDAKSIVSFKHKDLMLLY